MSEPGSLLHNMSVPPRTTVSYAGLVRRGKPAARPALAGRAIRFRLPEAATGLTAEGILDILGVIPGATADETLSGLIDARATELPLPEGCAVIGAQARDPLLFPDLLSALAVLTKCSAHVWLRAKRPSLSAGLALAEVSLLAPPAFIHRLPKAP